MKEPATTHVMDMGGFDHEGKFHLWAPNSPPPYKSAAYFASMGLPMEEPQEQPEEEIAPTPQLADDNHDEVLLPLLEEDPILISSDSSSSSSASSSASPSESSAGSGYSWYESASSVDLNGSEFGSHAFDSSSSTSKSATISSSSEKSEGSSSGSSWAATRRGRGRMFGLMPYSKK